MPDRRVFAARPFHVEAYPRLDLRRARRERAGGRTLVVWQDQEGTLVGMARPDFARGRLTIHARFRSLPYIPHGVFHEELSCELISRVGIDDDVLAICPNCQRNVRHLSFNAGTWLCQDCQRLAYRSTLVTKRLRDSERLLELTRMLADGRPRSMQAQAHAELRAERSELRLMLDGKRSSAPPHQQWLLTERWLVEPGDMLHGEAFAEVAGTGGGVLDQLGDQLFRGLPPRRCVDRTIRLAVAPAWHMLREQRMRVSALRVRRQIPPELIGEVPVFGPAGGIEVREDPKGGQQIAALAVTFTGDAALFRIGLPAPRSNLRPLARVDGDRLMIETRFDAAAAPFVAAQLHAERDLIAEGLERLRGALAELRVQFPALLKHAVDTELAKLRPRRRKRPSG